MIALALLLAASEPFSQQIRLPDQERAWTTEPPARSGARQSAQHGGRQAVAAMDGLWERTGAGEWQRLEPVSQARAWSPRDVRGVAYGPRGELWFASPQGVGRRDTSGAWSLWSGEDGLPYADFTRIATAPDGSLWAGTHKGAIHFDGRTWEYRQGRRWLPDDDVLDVVVDASNVAWFRTAKGTGRIGQRSWSLREKARWFEEEIDRRHRRTPYGYVLEVHLAKPGDKESAVQHDSDNDGLWTAMYGAGECFAYAATKDAFHKQRAQRAFAALKFLGDVTQGGTPKALPGFVARTVLPASAGDPNQRAEYTPEGDRRKQARDSLWKILTPRWGLSADKQWYWKTDTSSDELDGHYFFYGVYHDLVAETPAEKQAVRDVVRAITDHLLAHDFNLIDHDGTPTRWGVFSPSMLNRNRDWWEERGLNSLSIITYLKVAFTLTGDAKYEAAFNKLIRDEGYAQNAMTAKPSTATGSGNQSDDEMAFMNYYNLLRYEKDPKLHEMWALSLANYWRHEQAELNPFFAFTAEAMLKGATFQDNGPRVQLGLQGAAVPGAVDTLRRYPMDQVNWAHTNAHRADLVWLAPGRALRRNGLVLPADERHFNHWNHDPYRPDSGGSGNGLACATPFLLGYYMGLYHGYIE